MTQFEPTRVDAPCVGCGATFHAYVGADGPERYCPGCEDGLPLEDGERASIPGSAWREMIRHCRQHYGRERLRVANVRRYPRALDPSTPRGRVAYSVDVEYTRSGYRAMFGVHLDGTTELWQD